MLKKILLLIAPFVLYGIGYLLLILYPVFDICLGGDEVFFGGENRCWSHPTGTAHALTNLAMYSLPVAILLFFAPAGIIKIWFKRFAVWFIPGTALLLILQPQTADAFDPSQPGRIVLSVWLGTIFLIVSSIIIFFANRKERGSK